MIRHRIAPIQYVNVDWYYPWNRERDFTHENGSSFPFHAILLAKVQDVVGLYVDPPEHALVLSVDEKSQI